MIKRSRIVVALASLALLTLFFLPLWHIALEAPQYPEGLGMYIRVNTIGSVHGNDLQSINELNHYIGMKPITPESIPELHWMPWVVVGLCLFGLLTALLARRAVLMAWLGTVGVVGAVGLWDFWRWGYDYGHHLNPKAAIKIPGMSYQPPLIGTKQMLNITSHSWPALGGWILILAVVLAVGVLLLETLRKRGILDAAGQWQRQGQMPATPGRGFTGVLALIVGLLAACGPAGPRPIAYGKEACANCLMTVSDSRFGAELVTRTGKVHVFDSAECLAEYVRAHPAEATGSLWVTDFGRPGTLLPAAGADYLRTSEISSPMGLGVAAFDRQTGRPAGLTGVSLSWVQVLALAGPRQGGGDVAAE